jgi:hypothetical protein
MAHAESNEIFKKVVGEPFTVPSFYYATVNLDRGMAK